MTRGLEGKRARERERERELDTGHSGTRASGLHGQWANYGDDECPVSAAIWVLTIVGIRHPFGALLAETRTQTDATSLSVRTVPSATSRGQITCRSRDSADCERCRFGLSACFMLTHFFDARGTAQISLILSPLLITIHYFQTTANTLLYTNIVATYTFTKKRSYRYTKC